MSSARDDAVLDAVAGSRVSSSGWMRGDCPWCELRTGKPDRKRCLGLRVGSGYWHCLRCQTAGRVRDVPEDLSDLAPPEREGRDGPLVEVPLPEEFAALYEEPGWSSWDLAPFREYLEGRGVPAQLGADAGVGACLDGRYRGRVVVPVWSPPDELGERVAWGFSARATWKGATAKYLYPPEMRRGEVVFNAEALFTETEEPAFVGEGAFDALEFGLDDGVGCLGKPTEAQVECLLAARRPLVVVLDGDAHREAEALALRLRFEGLRAGWVRLPPTLDPPKVGAEKIRALASEALRAP